MADQLNELSATEIARRVAAGETTAEAVTRDCLARIEERDGVVHAWAFLDPDLALSQARALDNAASRGPLHGVPVGVKDIIDTADMPTGMGSPIYDGHRPAGDASCVGLMRAAGAVILGKTVTCEFAGSASGATTNPLDPMRTPGGSSSGSGAAVADFMAAAAFGTQTGGSVLRPSTYCGIFGYKPSYGTFNFGGVNHAAESLDTLGLHVRDLDDIGLLTDALTGRPFSPREAPGAPPAIGLCRTNLWDEAEPETKAAVEDAAARHAAAGASLRDVTQPEPFSGLTEARDVINAYERARLMAYEWAHHHDQLSDKLERIIRRGLDMPYAEYLAAMRLMEDCRGRMGTVFEGLDVLLAPAADGEAPVGLDYTGNPRFQGLWTMMHAPTLSMPTHRGPNGLPVGTQLIGQYREDDRMLSAARWVWDTLGPA